ncbi:DUF1697 domain-containing protein [Isoptericola sp. BMS4]|uniref:DUF1697 domain-containing protein n=1 Tax=Isoptericola sp. BMS4 TaxID=2527875 RepID=UPI001F109F32|nr:DUF1697 domain-containing protein [Isoptericola sp. BMS4]
MSDTAHVVLLRGVNLGPHRRVGSADLRAAATDAGLTHARTYANSGNLVAVSARPDADVAGEVSAALEHLTGTAVPAVALAADDLAALVDDAPFPDAARDRPAQLQLHVGPEPVDEAGLAALAKRNPGRERFAVARGALFVDYVDGIGRSRVTTAAVDRAAGTWTTARNWRTVLRLLSMARESAGAQRG